MKISNTDGDEQSWTCVLRHLGDTYPRNTDVEFYCQDGQIRGNLLLLSRTSKLLQNLLAKLSVHQASLERNGALKILLPEISRSVVEKWLHLVFEGSVLVSGRSDLNAFNDFLKKTILFTGIGEMVEEQEATAEAEQGDPAEDLASLSLVEDLVQLRKSDAVIENHAVEQHEENVGLVQNLSTKCPECTVTVSNQNNLLLHLAAKHYAKKIIEKFARGQRCKICKKSFTKKYGLIAHIGIRHGVLGHLANDAASRSFLSKIDPNFSTKEPLEKECVKCPDCNKLFTSGPQLLTHLALVHYSTPLVSTYKSLYRKHKKCNLCGLVVSDNQVNRGIARHYGKTHKKVLDLMSPEKRMACEALCAAPEASPVSRPPQRKRRVDNGGPDKYRCQWCSTTKPSLSKIYRHVSLTHYGKRLKKIYVPMYQVLGKCDICGIVLQQRNLESRIALHYGATHKKVLDLEKPELLFQLAVPAAEKAHKVTSHSPNSSVDTSAPRFPCPDCEKNIVGVHNLYQHTSTVHYLSELLQEYLPSYNKEEKCHLCAQKLTGQGNLLLTRIAIHYGVTHKFVFDLMTVEKRKLYCEVGIQRQHADTTFTAKGKHVRKHCAPSPATTRSNGKISCPDCPTKMQTLHGLYNHASFFHYSPQLLDKYLPSYMLESKCHLCSMVIKGHEKNRIAVHYGCRHKKLFSVMSRTKSKAYQTAAGSHAQKMIQPANIPTTKQQQQQPVGDILFSCPHCSASSKTRYRAYRHSALNHFREDITRQYLSRYRKEGKCHLCGLKLRNRKVAGVILHYGATHNKILKFMDAETKEKYLSIGFKQPVRKPDDDCVGPSGSSKGRKCPECSNWYGTSFSTVLEHAASVHHREELTYLFYNDFCSNGFRCSRCRWSKKNANPLAVVRHFGSTHKEVLNVITDPLILDKYHSLSETTVQEELPLSNCSSDEVSSKIDEGSGEVKEECCKSDIIPLSCADEWDVGGSATKEELVPPHFDDPGCINDVVPEDLADQLLLEKLPSSPDYENGHHPVDDKPVETLEEQQMGENVASLEAESGMVTPNHQCPYCDCYCPSFKSLLSHATFMHHFENIKNHYLPAHMTNQNVCPLCKCYKETIETRIVQHYGVKHRKVLEFMNPGQIAKHSKAAAATSICQIVGVQSLSLTTASEDQCGEVSAAATTTTTRMVMASSRHEQNSLGESNEQDVRPSLSNRRVRCPHCSRSFEKAALVYNHAAKTHFKEKLLEDFKGCRDEEGSCQICGTYVKSVADAIATHYGVRHKKIFDYMDPEWKERYLGLSSDRQGSPVGSDHSKGNSSKFDVPHTSITETN